MPSADYHGLVILPDSGQDLLRQELAAAFSGLGFALVRPHPDHLENPDHPHYLPRLLERKPSLFFSVNMQGILRSRDAGKNLLSSGTPVLAWLVDNPWHILSGLRDPAWKHFHLALTDSSFDEDLQKAGGKPPLHMPLASGFFTPPREQASPARLAELREIVFVGRPAFPGWENFFQGQKLPEELLREAKEQIQQGFRKEEDRPDFYWWTRRLRLETKTGFWPGKTARRPGLGAAICNAWWRTACLMAAQTGKKGLTLWGGEGWKKEILTDTTWDLRGTLDYYADLPLVYRSAAFSLNLNSLLLPGGLSQRVFDVWAAGGFCLTDWSPGLAIFPAELTKAICFRSPAELPDLAASLRRDATRREALRKAWQEEIRSRHTYAARLRVLLDQLRKMPC